MLFTPLQRDYNPLNSDPPQVFPNLKGENSSGYGMNTNTGEVLKQSLLLQDQHHSSTTFVKYPELYPNPEYNKYNEGGYAYSKYPDSLFPGQYGPEDYLDLFPVDTPNTIPTSAGEFKQHHKETSPGEAVPNNGVTASLQQQPTFSEDQTFDINALLAFPETTGGAQDTFVSDFCWQMLENLEPSLLKESELVQQLEGNLPDEIYSLPGLEKDASYQAFTKDQEASCDMLSPLSDQGTPYQQLPTPMDQSDSISSLSPLTSPGSSQPTPVAMVPMLEEMGSNSGDSGVLWRRDLRTLFEKTFDLNELANDFMIVPPSEEKPSLPVAQSPPPEVDKKPVILDPPLPSTFEAPPKTFQKSEFGKEEVKAKPTLLFGKHEGEIIHKLLALKKGSHSKPVTRDKLISMPVEEFNSLLEQAHLSEIEVAFMKEWRRGGKNKAAAQIARKRKREEVSGLDQEVQNMRQEKARLEKRCRQLQSRVEAFKERAHLAEEKIYQKQSALMGKPVNRKTHHILVTEDDQLLLVPRASS